MGKSECHPICENSCCKSTPNPSVCQNLAEMDFERSIWQAAIDDNVHKIKDLIENKKIDPNAADQYGICPLHYAARNGNINSAELLLQLGANINLKTLNIGATALHRAVTANKINMVKFLVERRADKTLEDHDGLTPLNRAEKEGRIDIGNILRG